MQYKIGDLVVLKSGGPVLTVEKDKIQDSPHIYCIWFRDGSVFKQNFHPDTLEKWLEKPAINANG
jgi:uncharacterized protein YodC (DUF2158 family)